MGRKRAAAAPASNPDDGDDAEISDDSDEDTAVKSLKVVCGTATVAPPRRSLAPP